MKVRKIVDEFLKYNNTKGDEFKLDFEKSEKDYRKINNRELNNFLDKKHGELEISRELQKLNKNDLLVSYDFNSLYPCA